MDGQFLGFVRGSDVVHNSPDPNYELWNLCIIAVEEEEEKMWVVLFKTEAEPLQPDSVSVRKRGSEHLVSFLANV